MNNTLAKQSFKLLKQILDSDHPDALKLSNTPFGYLGTDNMTEEQLKVHHATLVNNMKCVREWEKQRV